MMFVSIHNIYINIENYMIILYDGLTHKTATKKPKYFKFTDSAASPCSEQGAGRLPRVDEER